MGFARQVMSSRVSGEPAAQVAVQVLPAPGFGPRRANPSVTCLGLAVPAKSAAEPEAAWALVEWLALGEPARERFASGQGIPASRASLSDTPLWGAEQQQTTWQQQLAALVQQEVAETQAFCIQTSPTLGEDLLVQAWKRQEERFLTGQVGLNEMLAAVEEEVRLANLQNMYPFS